MFLIIRHPAGRLAERAYIIDVVIRQFLGLDYVCQEHAGSDVKITVSADCSRRVLCIPDIFLSTGNAEWLTPNSLPSRPLSHIDRPGPSSLPVIYGRPSEGRWIYRSEDQSYLGVDVFGSAFFMLTRYEEAVHPARDHYGRFPAQACLAAAEEFLDRPVVNEYIELLWEAIADLCPNLTRKTRSYRAFISHDVDEASIAGRTSMSILRSAGCDVLVRREPALALRKLRAHYACSHGKAATDDPYNTFDFIMDVSEKYGLRDAFYFVVTSPKHPLDPRYDIDHPSMRKLMSNIHQRGHEIGFHGSFNSYSDARKTSDEFKNLLAICEQEGISQRVWGGRQHYLRWANPLTWKNWADAGLDYDSTLTYAERPGFRTGSCFEYPAWDLAGRKQLRIKERPLIVMEFSLLFYMKCSLRATEEHILDLIATCRRFRGDFTLLWHSHLLVGQEAQRAYRRIIQAAA